MTFKPDCNKCERWALGCELNGARRRFCKQHKYILFKAKKIK
jgi:hypothetical protein